MLDLTNLIGIGVVFVIGFALFLIYFRKNVEVGKEFMKRILAGIAGELIVYNATQLTRTSPSLSEMLFRPSLYSASEFPVTFCTLRKHRYRFQALPQTIRTFNYPIYKIGLFTNKYILMAIAWETFLLSMLFSVPFLNTVFGIVPLQISEWAIVIPVINTCLPKYGSGRGD